MTYKTFFTQLLLVTLVAVVMIVMVDQVPALSAYTDLSWVTCAFFVFVCINLFFFGHRAASSDSKYAFTNIIFAFMMGKMMLTIGLVMGYNNFMQPTTKLFLVPFFMVYLIYTIFETYFMMKLGKVSPNEDNKNEF